MNAANVLTAIETLQAEGLISTQETLDILKGLIRNGGQTVPIMIPQAKPIDEPVQVQKTNDAKYRVTRNSIPGSQWQRVVNDIANGKDCLEVARDENVSESYIKNFCDNNNLQYSTKYGRSNKRIDEVQRAKIRELRKNGTSVAQIQITMDVSQTTVHNVLKQA